MKNAITVYKKRYSEGKVYSHLAYMLGAWLRRKFTDAGAVAWLRGPPVPEIKAKGGSIVVGDVGIYPGVRMVCRPGARIKIDNGTYINRNTLLYAEKEITIGANAMISWDVIITDTDGFGEKGNPGGARPVRIGDGTWIGSKAIILGGADIGDGAIIAGGSVVSGAVNPGAIVVSRPAKELFRLDERQNTAEGDARCLTTSTENAWSGASIR
jgi:acetyltransferase-like isoleucine patch superfamily enzyme